MKKDMNNKVDSDFTDINKENPIKNYIIVGILYILVIILSIFLILGLQNQKEVIDNNYNNTQENINNKNENKVDKNVDKKGENKTENDVQVETNTEENNVNEELNILDQLR